MVKPVHVFVDRKELIGYTGMTLTRSKNDMTGQLDIDVFMGWLPDEPVMDQVTRGQEILVYIGGHLAFTGVIDRRQDKASKSTASTSVGPDQYSVSFNCRGKTRAIVDNSHQETETTILRPTNKSVFERLLRPWDVPLEWEADVIDLDRVRLRDGARVADELQRLAEQTSLYVFETRDGSVKVTDKPGEEQGEPIVLGINVLSFNTDQAADVEHSEVLVKGQRTDPQTWGEEAVTPTLQRVADSVVPDFRPLTVQFFGNATDELLSRRANYEANKRMSQSKRVTVEVFHVQQSDGSPWDIGDRHYVELPPAGVFGEFEVVDVRYTIQNDKTLKTNLTLAPLPATPKSPDAASGTLGSLDELPTGDSFRARAFRYGTSTLANSWAGPALAVATTTVAAAADQILDGIEQAQTRPIKQLPPGFQGADE